MRRKIIFYPSKRFKQMLERMSVITRKITMMQEMKSNYLQEVVSLNMVVMVAQELAKVETVAAASDKP